MDGAWTGVKFLVSPFRGCGTSGINFNLIMFMLIAST